MGSPGLAAREVRPGSLLAGVQLQQLTTFFLPWTNGHPLEDQTKPALSTCSFVRLLWADGPLPSGGWHLETRRVPEIPPARLTPAWHMRVGVAPLPSTPGVLQLL